MCQHVKGIRQERKAVCYITTDTLDDHHRTGKDGNHRQPFFLNTPVDMFVRMVVMLIVVCYLRVVTVFHDSLVYENCMLHAIWLCTKQITVIIEESIDYRKVKILSEKLRYSLFYNYPDFRRSPRL